MYRNNIHGWLTRIKNAALSADANNDDESDYFGMELGHHHGVSTGNLVPLKIRDFSKFSFAMKTAFFILVFLAVIPYNVLGQQRTRCDSLYHEIDSLVSKIGLVVYDSAPLPQGEPQRLYVSNASGGESGIVFVRLLIDAEGKTRCVTVIRSDNSAMNSTAVRKVQKLKFRPAMKDGLPVVSSLVLPIYFGPEKE